MKDFRKSFKYYCTIYTKKSKYNTVTKSPNLINNRSLSISEKNPPADITKNHLLDKGAQPLCVICTFRSEERQQKTMSAQGLVNA
jgi:hypothetical protein